VAFVKKPKDQEQETPAGFGQMYDSFLSFVERTPSKQRRTYMIGSLVVAAILIVLASLPLNISTWVFVLIGFPAGLIVFANCVALTHFTRLRDSKAFTYKDRVPPTKRIKTVGLGIVVIVAILISLGGLIPYGLGGTIVITLALFAYNIIRRTPDELRLAKLGLPDPREFENEDEEN
jgi:amino acid transporter